jgi:hypothetical protein
VKLVSINLQDLPLDRALPFALRDASGRLLLGAGTTVTDDRQRQELLEQPLFAEEHHCAEWRRRVAAAMDQQLRQGAALKDVVRALPDDAPREPVARHHAARAAPRHRLAFAPAGAARPFARHDGQALR